MDDKELVEVWRHEFEQLVPNANLSKHPEGDYARDPIDARWRGFLMAKRAQPVVDLCKLELPIHDMDNELYHDGYYDCLNEITSILQAAGIKYKIGE